MDSLKSLLDKKEYDLVLSLTNDDYSLSSLTYRISAYIGKNQYEEALRIIEDHRQDFQKVLNSSMRLHIEILLHLALYDKAYDELEYYKQLPYFSQEVEEQIAVMPSIIKEAEIKSRTIQGMTEEKAKDIILSSNDDFEVLMVLESLKNKNIIYYVSEIEKLFLRDVHPYVKTYGLLLLVDGKINKEIHFKKEEKDLIVNPSQLFHPFEGEKFNSLIRKLSNGIKDVTIGQVASSILNSYILDIYPDDAFTDDFDYLYYALLSLANDYINTGVAIDSICPQECDIDKVKTIKKKIVDHSTDPLKMNQ